MAIVVSGLDSLEGNIDGKDGSSSSTVTYRVETTDSPLVVGDIAISAAVSSASGFSIGTPYPFDANSWCRKISSRCQGRRTRGDGVAVWTWKTTLEFSSATESDSAGDGGGGEGGNGGFTNQRDPSLRAPRISLSARPFDEPVSIDINGANVRNSAGDPIVRTRKNAHLIVRWDKFVRTWDWRDNRPVHAGGYLYSRNQDAWAPAGPYTTLLGATTVAAGQAQMQSITTDISFEAGGGVNVSVEIAIDPNAFKDIFLDQGFFYNGGAGGGSMADPVAPANLRRRFVDRNGVATGPQLLDGNGAPLAEGADPVNIERQYYGLKDWNASPWGPTTTDGRFFALPAS
jgi:hypothetical protein